jgi:hypothetical protein
VAETRSPSVLEALRGCRERIEETERDRNALLGNYARIGPETLYELAPKAGYQGYRILRLPAAVMMDGALDVSGIFGEGNVFCPMATPSSTRWSSRAIETDYSWFIVSGTPIWPRVVIYGP